MGARLGPRRLLLAALVVTVSTLHAASATEACLPDSMGRLTISSPNNRPVVPSKRQRTDAAEDEPVVLAAQGANSARLTAAGNRVVEQPQCRTGPRLYVVELATTCGGRPDARFTEIGWREGDEFVRQITVCHVRASATTLYANHTVERGATGASGGRTTFRHRHVTDNAIYPTSSVLEYYKVEKQRETIRNDRSRSFIDYSRPTHYLVKGHLAPNADFVDAAKRRATFYLINAAPQWQSFNNGNWKALEDSIRRKAGSERGAIHVYTGVYGALRREDLGFSTNGRDYVYLVNGSPLLPVPKYFWKVVHHPASRRAVAFVGWNNPNARSAPSDSERPCKVDRCSATTWEPGSWKNRENNILKQRNITEGYMYCCSVRELRQKVSHMPDLGDLARLA